MKRETCFVIMPIGDQTFGDLRISASALKDRYTDLIKEAIEAARADMDVVRADEVYAPGGITADVYARLMHSTFVVADITFPNPNVFYELGIRHACRYGTILIKAKDGPPVPFDVAGQRYLAYENTPTGLKALAGELKRQFDWFDANPREPDSDFQRLASLTKFQFPTYFRLDAAYYESMAQATTDVLIDPNMREVLIKSTRGDKLNAEDKEKMFRCLLEKPEALRSIIECFLHSGMLPG